MRLLPIILSAPLFLAAAPPEQVSPRQVERAYKICQKGERALKAGNIVKARSSFDEALGLVPDFTMAHLGVGHVLMQQRRFAEALDSYHRALAGYLSMGDAMIQLETDRYAQSREMITRKQDEVLYLSGLLPRSTSPQRIQQIRARIWELENDIRDLEAMPIPTPDSAHEPPARIYFFLGNALVNLERTEEAIEAYRTCCLKDPSFALGHHNLAISLWKAGQIEEARLHLARAEELGLPVNPELQARLSPRSP